MKIAQSGDLVIPFMFKYDFTKLFIEYLSFSNTIATDFSFQYW